MGGYVRSLNVGQEEPNPAKRVGSTGIGKRRVASVEVRPPGPKRGGLGSGVVGDYIGDARYHGGDRQAVYAFAREELDAWSERLGRPLADGTFGENLTTSGLDVDGSLVGERWAVGDDVVLEVTAPRTPCATFQHRMGERGWVRRFTEHGRTGAYLSVVVPGTMAIGDPVDVVHRPDHDISLITAFRALIGDADAAERVLAADCLPAVDAERLRRRLQRRR